MAIPKIEIKTDGVTSSILIDGEEFGDKVKAVRFEHSGGGLPLLHLELVATNLSLSGEFIPTLPEPFDKWYCRKQKDVYITAREVDELLADKQEGVK